MVRSWMVGLDEDCWLALHGYAQRFNSRRIHARVKCRAFSVWSNQSLMVRDARRCRAPHHEGLEDLILRSIAQRCVSKDEATGLENALVQFRTSEIDIRLQSRAAIRPRFGRTPSITEGAGNAGCPLHPQPRVRK